MKPATLYGPFNIAGPAETATDEAGYALRLVLVYQDDETRQWANEVYTKVARIVGQEAIRPAWLNLASMNRASVLAEGIARAAESDVMVVAVRSGAELPLAFYYWTEAWLAHRCGEPGALVALIGSTANGCETDETREYLRALSRTARLDFIVAERRLPGAADGFKPEPRSAGLLATAAGCPSWAYF